jgi:hypothetical protein
VILFAGAPQTCDTEGHVEPVVGLCDNNRPLDVQLRRGRRLARFDRRLRRVGPSARCHFRSSFVFSIFAPRNSRLGTRIPFSFLQPYLLFLFDLTGLLWLCIINGSIWNFLASPFKRLEPSVKLNQRLLVCQEIRLFFCSSNWSVCTAFGCIVAPVHWNVVCGFSQNFVVDELARAPAFCFVGGLGVVPCRGVAKVLVNFTQDLFLPVFWTGFPFFVFFRNGDGAQDFRRSFLSALPLTRTSVILDRIKRMYVWHLWRISLPHKFLRASSVFFFFNFPSLFLSAWAWRSEWKIGITVLLPLCLWVPISAVHSTFEWILQNLD